MRDDLRRWRWIAGAVALLFSIAGGASVAETLELPKQADADMQEIETQIDIDAPAARVWAVLTDLEAMPSWNPFIREIAGKLAEGERLLVRIAPPGEPTMSFAPTVLASRPGRELRWRGSLVAPGLFAGEHVFCIEPLSARKTRFIQRESFSGLLAPLLMSGSRLSATRAGFGAMNEALKRRVEALEPGALPHAPEDH